MALGLTPIQAQLLRFIIGFQAAHGGVSPSLVECARGVGNVAKSSICRTLACLEDRGAIRTLPGKARAIQVIKRLPIPSIDGTPLYAVPTISFANAIFSGERP